MTKSRSMTTEMAILLDAVGGEPFAGSGFENELPEPGFDQMELGRVEFAREG